MRSFQEKKIMLYYFPFMQRAKLTKSTPMTPALFMQWKKKKLDERDAGLAAKQAERAKNDRMR
jgi:DRG Family Regulatory Proteins, Tma46